MPTGPARSAAEGAFAAWLEVWHTAMVQVRTLQTAVAFGPSSSVDVHRTGADACRVPVQPDGTGMRTAAPVQTPAQPSWTTETPGFAQAVFFIVAEIPPARIDVLAVPLNHETVDVAPQVVVVNADFGAQGVFNSLAEFAGNTPHAVFPAHIVEANMDEANLAGIPRAMKPRGVHGDAAVVVEIQRQDDGFAGYGVQ